MTIYLRIDVDNCYISWLENYGSANDVIALVHPIWIAMDKTIASEFSQFLHSNLDIQPFSKLL